MESWRLRSLTRSFGSSPTFTQAHAYGVCTEEGLFSFYHPSEQISHRCQAILIVDSLLRNPPLVVLIPTSCIPCATPSIVLGIPGTRCADDDPPVAARGKGHASEAKVNISGEKRQSEDLCQERRTWRDRRQSFRTNTSLEDAHGVGVIKGFCLTEGVQERTNSCPWEGPQDEHVTAVCITVGCTWLNVLSCPLGYTPDPPRTSIASTLPSGGNFDGNFQRYWIVAFAL